MSTDTERRFTAGRVEIRASGDKGVTIGGYAAKFLTESQNLGGFVEQVGRGFFNHSKGKDWPDVMARYNHDDNRLLGTTAAGTLRLLLDEVGLDYAVDLPQSRVDVAELVERGDVNRSSFAFRAVEDDWDTNDQNFPRRTLLSGSLVDVAPVNLPAYSDTSAGLRSLETPDIAYRSLARAKDADIAEVRKLAGEGELRRFFIRTDGPPAEQPTSAAALLAAAMEIKV